MSEMHLKCHCFINSQCISVALLLFSQGAGTDEKVLIEILASRSPNEVNEIKSSYKRGKFRISTYLFILFI